ncbi:MAG: hypothetical protein ABSH19_06450 [Opitutales bacterium]
MKILLIFGRSSLDTNGMLSFFTPKTLALASGLALMLAGWPEGLSAQTQTKAVAVDGAITVSSVQDRYNSQNKWMQVEVDVTAKSNPQADATNPNWVKDVSVTLTLGWGASGDTPQLDLAVAATAKLVALQVNQRTAVLFYLPPEFLQAGSTNPSGLNADSKPTFYVASISAGKIAMGLTSDAVSSSLPDRNYVNGFLTKAADQVGKNAGMMLTADSVPFYVLSQGLGQLGGGAVIPTLKGPVPAAGP